VWQVLPCVVLWVSAGAALWSAPIRCAVVLGCAFSNKNKGLQRFLNEKDYMRFYLPINYSIISIMSLPHRQAQKTLLDTQQSAKQAQG